MKKHFTFLITALAVSFGAFAQNQGLNAKYYNEAYTLAGSGDQTFTSTHNSWTFYQTADYEFATMDPFLEEIFDLGFSCEEYTDLNQPIPETVTLSVAFLHEKAGLADGEKAAYAVFEGYLELEEAGDYDFKVESDIGFKMEINEQEVKFLNNGEDLEVEEKGLFRIQVSRYDGANAQFMDYCIHKSDASLKLPKGTVPFKLSMLTWNAGGGKKSMQLFWKSASEDEDSYEVIPAEAFYDAAKPNSINETTKINNSSVYPSIVNQYLNISMQEGAKEINILNSLGQVVKIVNTQNTIETVNMSTFNKGVYFVQVKTELGISTTHKVVKK